MEALVTWIVETIGRLGYTGIACLMALESSFFPFPSEVVMIPAGYLAQQGKMNLLVAIFLGIFGSLVGAYLNYAIAWYLGRPFIIRFGKYVGISEKKFSKVEAFFDNHGEITTFVGRLIPGIRQIISFPAGLGRMNLVRFSIYTGLGAGIWVAILALLGYWVGENEELWTRYSKQITYALVAGCVFLVAGYVYWKTRAKADQA